MVDHQHLTPRRGQLAQRAEPIDARDVHGDHKVGVTAHIGWRNEQMAAGQRLQRFGQTRRFGEADLDILACMVEHERQREPGTDGVGVGIDVADHADGAGCVEKLGRALGVDALTYQVCVGLRVNRGQRCPQRLARHPAPRRNLPAPGHPDDTGRRRPRAWHPAELSPNPHLRRGRGPAALPCGQRSLAPCRGRRTASA